jgi:hypothetical protein
MAADPRYFTCAFSAAISASLRAHLAVPIERHDHPSHAVTLQQGDSTWPSPDCTEQAFSINGFVIPQNCE